MGMFYTDEATIERLSGVARLSSISRLSPKIFSLIARKDAIATMIDLLTSHNSKQARGQMHPELLIWYTYTVAYDSGPSFSALCYPGKTEEIVIMRVARTICTLL